MNTYPVNVSSQLYQFSYNSLVCFMYSSMQRYSLSTQININIRVGQQTIHYSTVTILYSLS